MSKSAQNYTKLPKDILKNKAVSGIFHSVGDTLSNASDIIEKKNISNIFLIIAVIAFIASISYSISVNQNTQSSQASENNSGNPDPTPLVTLAPEYPEPFIQSFPEFYNGTPIPPQLLYTGRTYFSDIPEAARDSIVINNVVKYYVYYDVITEQGLTFLSASTKEELEELPEPPSIFLQSSVITHYVSIHSKVQDYEYTIKRQLVQNTDFYYMTVSYTQNNKKGDQEVENILGRDQKEAARETIERYQALFQENPENVERILVEASDDEILTTLNGTYDYTNNFRETYTMQDKLLPSNPDFNTFLFNLEENQVSDVYEYTNPNGNPIGFIIALPVRFVKSEYINERDIITEYLNLFE